MATGSIRPDRPRVCHLSTAHSADDSRVFWREARGLASRGFDVTLVARRDGTKIIDGVRVIGLPTYHSRLVRMTWGVLRAFWIALMSQSRLVHIHDPELVPLLIPLRLIGKKVVYDSHEWISRQVAAKRYLPTPLRRAAAVFARGLEWTAGRVAHRIVTVNSACASVFPAAKVSIVANYPERSRFPYLDMKPAGSAGATVPSAEDSGGETSGGEERVPVFVYVGGITANRGLREMITATAIVARDTSVRLRLAGRASPSALMDEVAAEPGWQNVDYVGLVPHDEVSNHMRGAVAGLATLWPTPNHLISSPIKVFEYMAMGLPVIMSDFPQWRALLDGVDCVMWIDPADPKTIAAAMHELLADPERRARMGEVARQAVLEKFVWEKQLDNLVDAYRRIGIKVG
ncbi:MAG: glycosyltransferase family 4 protein [Nakamurella sp.]